MMNELDFDTDEVIYQFADRFALQQAWWLASEIARRHPTLEITRVQGLDKYQLLIVHDGPTGRRIQFDLPSGALWKDERGEDHRLNWLDVFAQNDAHAVVNRLEQEAGFGSPKRTPATTERTIVYQLIACLLAAHVDDRHTWQAATAEVPLIAAEGAIEAAKAALAPFPTAQQAALAYVDVALAEMEAHEPGPFFWHQPMWFVLRDLEPVLVLDEGGFAHLRDGVKIDLLSPYRAFGRDLSAVASLLLMDPSIALGITLLLGRKVD